MSRQPQQDQSQPGPSRSVGDQPPLDHQPGPNLTQASHVPSSLQDKDDDEVRFYFEDRPMLPLPNHDDHIEGVDPTYVSPNFVFRPRLGSTPDEAVAQRLHYEESIRNWIEYEEELKRREQERVAALANGGPRVPMNFDAPANMPNPNREP